MEPDEELPDLPGEPLTQLEPSRLRDRIPDEPGLVEVAHSSHRECPAAGTRTRRDECRPGPHVAGSAQQTRAPPAVEDRQSRPAFGEQRSHAFDIQRRRVRKQGDVQLRIFRVVGLAVHREPDRKLRPTLTDGLSNHLAAREFAVSHGTGNGEEQQIHRLFAGLSIDHGIPRHPVSKATLSPTCPTVCPGRGAGSRCARGRGVPVAEERTATGGRLRLLGARPRWARKNPAW